MARQSLTPGERLDGRSVALRPGQWSTLMRWARQEDTSVSTLVRRALDEYIARRETPLGATDRMAV